MGALSGYRVVDLSIAMAGPLAAMRMGDLGADVVKVEPVTGEWQRHAPAGGATGNRINASFLALNRNKRSLALDLKSPAGRQAVHDLIAGADVFVQNYRTGVAERLGVDYESVRRTNPGIVYVSISGYGEDGPYANRPGQDLLLQAMSGAMYNVGREGDPPQPAGTYTIDAITAYSAVEGALAALLHRERTGEGQLVSVNMLDAALAVQAQELTIYTVGGVPQRRGGRPHGHTYIRAPYGAFATADGHVALAMPNLAVLGGLLGSAELSAMDENVDGHTRRDDINAIVSAALTTRTTGEWLELFAEHGLWASPVYAYADVLRDPQVRHNGSLVTYEHPTEGTVTTPGFPFRLSRTAPEVSRGAPLAGEHTRELLAELGYAADRIDALLAEGAAAQDRSAQAPSAQDSSGQGPAAQDQLAQRPVAQSATRQQEASTA
ncbi:CoA transferase [Streptomyces pathocidini]|uniref:CaiB/BaiF CoA transferase family protein n=1 Tax=Streptomyces pathocidini TaxID=1650571 RepID=UPI0033DCF9E0